MIALILVCRLAELASCTTASALDVISVPGRHVICPGLSGQSQLASTQIGRDLAPDEAVRIVCLRPKP